MSLLIEIDRFRRATGMPETLFGRLAVSDPRLVHDLRGTTGPDDGTEPRNQGDF